MNDLEMSRLTKADCSNFDFGEYSLDVIPCERCDDSNYVDLVNISIKDLSVNSVKEVLVPKELPNGQIIDGILSASALDYVDFQPFMERMRNGESVSSDELPPLKHIGRIIIADDISYIGRRAFADMYIDEVRWPSSCQKLSRGVFGGCTLQKIEGIKGVTEIEDGAFSYSGIRLIDWPAACASIPLFCFAGSGLETISGIDSVSLVRGASFAKCKNLKEIHFHQPYCKFETSAFYEVDLSAVRSPSLTDDAQIAEAISDKLATFQDVSLLGL